MVMPPRYPRVRKRSSIAGARICGVPVKKLIEARGEEFADFRASLEQAVRYANIAIIEGNDASQFGIVSARIAEIVIRDERAAIPIGSFNQKFGVTLSLPSLVGRHGVIEILEPDMSSDETLALERSVQSLKQALAGNA